MTIRTTTPSQNRALPPAHLGQLADDAVALGADELLHRGHVLDHVGALADLDAAAGVGEDLQPAVAGQGLGDDDALGPVFIVHLGCFL